MSGPTDEGNDFNPSEQYASLDQLSEYGATFAVPYVLWSVYPRLTNALLRSLLPELADFRPGIVLLDEDDEEVRSQLHTWFPKYFHTDFPIGAGALIWLKSGVPLHYATGPHLDKQDVLAISLRFWATDKK